MHMLLVIAELLQSCVQRFMHWISAQSRSRQSYKHQHSNGDNHRHSPQKPEWLKHETIRLKAIMPHTGCRSIADICNRRFAASRKITVGKTYVHQVLQRHDYEMQILRRNLKHAKLRVVSRSLIWSIDLTGKTDAQGHLHFLLGVIDHGSRALLRLQALHNKTSRTLLASLSEIIRTHCKPKIIRTGNEAIFTSRIFSEGLKRLGIRRQRTDPGCPWQNGRIERLFGTLKEKFDQWQLPDFAQLGFLLMMWVSMSAYSATMNWKEEVQLNDGGILVVERFYNLGGYPTIDSRERAALDETVTFNLPGTDKQITWKTDFSDAVPEPNSLNLLLLDVVNGVPYIATYPAGCIAYNKWKRPNPPYILFKHEAGEWKQIPLAEFPAELTKTNVIVGRPASELLKSFYKVGKVQEKNYYLQAEYKTILREPSANYGNRCEELVRYKGYWIMPNDPVARRMVDMKAK